MDFTFLFLFIEIMVKFEKKFNGVHVTTDNGKTVYPLGSLITHSNRYSETIDLKLRASRKTILSFRYDEVEGIDGDTPIEVQAEIALYL